MIVTVDSFTCRLCPRTNRLQVDKHGSWWLGSVVLPSSDVFDRAAVALGVSPREALKGRGRA